MKEGVGMQRAELMPLVVRGDERGALVAIEGGGHAPLR